MDRIEIGISDKAIAIERYGSIIRVYEIEKEQLFNHNDLFDVETYVINLLNDKAAKAGLSKEYLATWVKDQVSRITQVSKMVQKELRRSLRKSLVSSLIMNDVDETKARNVIADFYHSLGRRFVLFYHEADEEIDKAYAQVDKILETKKALGL